MISNVMFVLAGVLSLFAAWLIVACMRSQAKSNQLQRYVTITVAGSIVCTLIAILSLGFISQTGLLLTLTTVSGFTTILVQSLYLLGIWQHGVRGLGLLLLPLTAIPLFLLPLLPESKQWVEAHSFLQTVHLLLSVAGYAILTIAALYACMQLFLDYALKNKKIGFFMQAMPSLMDISNHLFVHVRWAIWFIGLSIVTGLSWQWLEMHHFALLNHKVLLALFAWLALLTLYQLRKKAAWHHNRASKMVLFAYVSLMLAYFGVKLIRSFI